METFLQQFGSKIKGVLTGFDRIVFKGCLRHLAYAEGAARFLAGRGVLNKDYKAWMLAQSAALVAACERLAMEQTGGQWGQPTAFSFKIVLAMGDWANFAMDKNRPPVYAVSSWTTLHVRRLPRWAW